jgi:hypothetical protein
MNYRTACGAVPTKCILRLASPLGLSSGRRLAQDIFHFAIHPARKRAGILEVKNMNIEWNKSTWYSWLATAAVALAFVALLMYLRYLHVQISLQIQRTVNASLERARFPVPAPKSHR